MPADARPTRRAGLAAEMLPAHGQAAVPVP